MDLLGVALALAAVVLAVVCVVRLIMRKPSRRLACISFGLLLAGTALAAFETGGLQSAALLCGLLLYLPAIGLALMALIRRIRKLPATRYAWLALLFFILATELSFLNPFNSAGLWRTTSSYGVFLLLIGIPLLITLVVRLVKKKPSSVLVIVAPALTVASIALLGVTPVLQEAYLQELEESGAVTEGKITTDYDFVVEEGSEPIEVVEVVLPSTHGDRTTVYGSEGLYRLFGSAEGTEAGCQAALTANQDIPERIKVLFKDYIHRIAVNYPQASLTILQHNLQTLHVEELDESSYVMKSLDVSSKGCYIASENAIYIPKGTEYVEGTWGFQVFIHEFCHAARICYVGASYGSNRMGIGFKDRAVFLYDSDGQLLEESMNSVFSCSLLNYDEWDIAYQVPSNYLRIMLDCMDNYELSDYMNHGDTYFYRKLDEASGHTNYAKVLWKLITLQRSDWENDKIDIDQAEYYPIYDFLCDIYYSKYLTPEMTDEEARQVADDLVYKAFYDAPEGYKICQQRFYDNLEARLAG